MITTNELTGVTYKVDSSASTLIWTGKKLIGAGHSGTIALKEGTLILEEDDLKAGEFIIDTTTITNTDLTDQGYNDMLVGHLRSDDFFAVEKFPEATFTITDAKKISNENYEITGDLQIKDITHQVSFPAEIKRTENAFEAKASINIDRTKYDIKYNSANFFSNLGDKVIKNEFTLDLHLVANK